MGFEPAPCLWSPIFHNRMEFLVAKHTCQDTFRPHDRFHPTAPAHVDLNEEDTKRLHKALTECYESNNKTYYDAAADGADRQKYYGDLLKNGMSGAQLYKTLSDLITK